MYVCHLKLSSSPCRLALLLYPNFEVNTISFLFQSNRHLHHQANPSQLEGGPPPSLCTEHPPLILYPETSTSHNILPIQTQERTLVMQKPAGKHSRLPTSSQSRPAAPGVRGYGRKSSRTRNKERKKFTDDLTGGVMSGQVGGANNSGSRVANMQKLFGK